MTWTMPWLGDPMPWSGMPNSAQFVSSWPIWAAASRRASAGCAASSGPSGRRSPRSGRVGGPPGRAARSPVNACGQVTSWTRWRSIARTAGAPVLGDDVVVPDLVDDGSRGRCRHGSAVSREGRFRGRQASTRLPPRLAGTSGWCRATTICGFRGERCDAAPGTGRDAPDRRPLVVRPGADPSARHAGEGAQWRHAHGTYPSHTLDALASAIGPCRARISPPAGGGRRPYQRRQPDPDREPHHHRRSDGSRRDLVHRRLAHRRLRRGHQRHRRASWSQPINQTLKFDDGLIRQGGSVPVARSVATAGAGTLSVTWHVTGDYGNFSTSKSRAAISFTGPVTCDIESNGFRIFGHVPVPFCPVS